MSFTPSDDDVLQDIFDAGREAMDLCHGMDEPGFWQDRRTQLALIQCLTIMGEAAKRLSRALIESHPEVDWSGMARMRDVLIHHYEKVNLGEVWRVATREVPQVVVQIEPLLPRKADE